MSAASSNIQHKFRSMILVLTVSLLLGSCVTYDAPPDAMGATRILYGVAVYSTAVPYRVELVSSLPPADSQSVVWNAQALQRQVQRLVSGHYANWQWSVWTTPVVYATWQRWNTKHLCQDSMSPCLRLEWNSAFIELYKTVNYLLGKSPLPLKLRLNLIAEGQGFHSRQDFQSGHSVPFEFTFWYPIGTATDPASQTARQQALVEAVSTIGYEFQHVEYAARDVAGRASPPGPRYLKDEANSACWKLSTRFVLIAGLPSSITVVRLTQGDLTRDAAEFGNRVRVQTAAVWGPALLQHDLSVYLALSNTASEGSTSMHISATDYSRMNRVLAYCRGFTRYGGDIAKKPMPLNNVAHTLFWQ